MREDWRQQLCITVKDCAQRKENTAGRISGIKTKFLRSLREETYRVGILMKDPVEMGKLMIQKRKNIAGQHP